MQRDIFERVKNALRKLDSSRDESYVKVFVPWDKGRGFSVECVRNDDDLVDEYGNVSVAGKGVPVDFSVYYQVNGADVDCCTLSVFLDQQDFNSLKKFVDMYRR